MDAVKNVDGGVLVCIDVSPNSKKFEISGYNEWRGEFEVKITTVPQKGKANKEIIQEFNKLTNSRVEIACGLKSRHKTLRIDGMSKQEFLNVIKEDK